MYRPVGVAIAVGILFLGSGSAYGQFGPVVWQQPAPVIWQQPAPVVWQQPAPIVSRSFPTVASPVVVQSPSMVVSPAPVTRVYRPAFIGYQPVRTTYTRRRPILGGTVTRYRYGFQRVAF